MVDNHADRAYRITADGRVYRKARKYYANRGKLYDISLFIISFNYYNSSRYV